MAWEKAAHEQGKRWLAKVQSFDVSERKTNQIVDDESPTNLIFKLLCLLFFNVTFRV